MTSSRLSFGFSGDVDTTLKSWTPKLRSLVSRVINLEGGLGATGINISAGVHFQDETIAAGGTWTLPHGLGVLPSMVIFTKVQGTPAVFEGASRDENNVYIKNNSSSQSATVSVLVVP